MKITLIGHACLLIQSKETTLLTDPCLFDIHFEDINLYYPTMELDRDKMPPVDILYLSHRHQDHFDIRTLATLPKDLKLLAPKDNVMLECLQELEFTNVKIVEDFEPIKFKDLTLTPTPSITQDSYPEHGLLIHDGEVTVWNQVDTIVTPEIVKYIINLYGQLDFAHVRFQPLLEQHYAFHKPCQLPFQEYHSFLQVVGALRPKFIVPGSAGERYVDKFEFLNHFVFPTQPDQFLKDMKEFAPEVKSSLFISGDVAEITPQGANIHSQASDFVRTVENKKERTMFNPVSGVPSIRTLTEDPEQHDKERQAVTEFIENELASKLEKCELSDAWFHWRLGYQLEVFGQDGSEIWSVDFGQEPKVVKQPAERLNLYEGIGCSELYGLINKTTNWDFVGASAQFRTFNNIYKVDQGHYEYFSQDKKFPQPLMQVFPANEEMDREKYMKDVRKWKNQTGLNA